MANYTLEAYGPRKLSLQVTCQTVRCWSIELNVSFLFLSYSCSLSFSLSLSLSLSLSVVDVAGSDGQNGSDRR